MSQRLFLLVWTLFSFQSCCDSCLHRGQECDCSRRMLFVSSICPTVSSSVPPLSPRCRQFVSPLSPFLTAFCQQLLRYSIVADMRYGRRMFERIIFLDLIRIYAQFFYPFSFKIGYLVLRQFCSSSVICSQVYNRLIIFKYISLGF